MHDRIRRLVALATRHRALTAVAVLVAAALTIGGVAWFEPHKLVVDDRVDEAVPAAALPAANPTPAPSPAAALPAASPTPAPSPAAPSPSPATAPSAAPAEGQAAVPAAPEAPSPTPEVRTVARAPFRSLEHTTTGDAVLLGLPDGSRVLRLESFATSNGPDLRVYLSAGSDDSSFGRQYGEDFVELGVLKGNIGSQNYAIPAGTDLSRYRNAVVWCKRFSVGFGVATFS
jgi:hypothetical protein